MSRFVDLTGKKIGVLTVIRKSKLSKNRSFKMDMQMSMW